MSTLLWDVRAALTQTFTAAPAVTATGAHVFAGPRPRSSAPLKQFVLVGSDGGDTGAEASADGMDATQTPSDLGPGGWTDEEGSVLCAVWAWSGNSTLTSAQDAARALFDGCTGALAADRSLGGLLTLPGLARLSAVSVVETQTKAGPLVRIAFSVSYGALITT